MFCPKCRTEYIEGIKDCSDCNVDLVEELQPEEESLEPRDMVEVFTTSTSLEANFIKSLLGSNNIECTIVNEHLVSINIFLSNAIPIKIAVDKKNQTRAMEVIEQYFKDLRNEE